LHDILTGARHFDDKKLHLPTVWVDLAEEFGQVIHSATPDYLSAEYKEMLKVSLKEVQGVSPQNFMMYPIFRKSLVAAFFKTATSANEVGGILFSAAKTMVSKMQDAMQEALDAKVDEYITEFPRLNDHVKDRISQLLKTQSRVVVHHLEAILKAELAKPFTFNHYYMDTLNKVRNGVMSRSRSLMMVGSRDQALRVGDRVTPSKGNASKGKDSKGTVVKCNPDSTAEVDIFWDDGTTQTVYDRDSQLQLLGAEAIEGVTGDFIEDAAKIFAKGQSNSDQAVIDMQLSIFSYSKVLLKCILDDVPKLVWSELLYTVNVELSSFVKKELMDPANLAELMAEDPVKASKRKRLELTITRFKESLKIMRAIK
jgi:hypothetical protein